MEGWVGPNFIKMLQTPDSYFYALCGAVKIHLALIRTDVSYDVETTNLMRGGALGYSVFCAGLTGTHVVTCATKHGQFWRF